MLNLIFSRVSVYHYVIFKYCVTLLSWKAEKKESNKRNILQKMPTKKEIYVAKNRKKTLLPQHYLHYCICDLEKRLSRRFGQENGRRLQTCQFPSHLRSWLLTITPPSSAFINIPPGETERLNEHLCIRGHQATAPYV